MSGSQQTDTHLLALLFTWKSSLAAKNNLVCTSYFHLFDEFNIIKLLILLNVCKSKNHPLLSFHLMTPYPSLCCHTRIFLCLPNILYTSSLVSPCTMFLLTSSFGNCNLSACLKINWSVFWCCHTYLNSVLFR